MKTELENCSDGGEMPLKGKPYQAPRLIVHGTLAEITNAAGSGPVDFPMGSTF
jgi:hypothetical protein